MKKLFLLNFVLFLVTYANAQWESNGPAKVGYINCLTVDGSQIFAGTDSGIYVSNNQGSSWKPANSGLPITQVNAIAVNNDSIFAGTFDGIYISGNNGSSWNILDSNIGPLTYAISGPKIFAAGFQGIFLSTDSGKTWSEADSDIPYNTTIEALAIHNSTIYAGTYGRGLFVSYDDGIVWEHDTIENDVSDVYALAVQDSIVYAGTQNGVYISTYGSAWSTINNALNDEQVNALLVSGSNIFAGTNNGVYLSTNIGESGTSLNLPYGVWSLAVNDSILYAGASDNGIWQLKITTTLAIPEIPEPTTAYFTLSPNPAINNFSIETNIAGQQELQFFNVAGKLVLIQTIQNQKTTIDANGLAAGIYFVSLKSDEAESTKKLIILR